MKRIYLTLGILLVGTLAMAYVYFSNLNTDKNANDLALNAVAKNCPIVFSFDNDKSFYEILSRQDLIQRALGETKSRQLDLLHDHLIANQLIFTAIEGQKTFIGISGVQGGADFIIATQLKPGSKPQTLINSLGPNAVKVKKNQDIFELTFKDSLSVFVAVHANLILISNHNLAVSPLNQSQQNDASFVAYIKENSRLGKNNLANLFLNFNKMPSLLANILANNLTGELNIFNQQDTYAAFSYNFSKEKLLFSGNTVVNNPDNFYKLFASLEAQQLTMANILPQTTANYTIYGINNYLAWQKKLQEWFSANKSLEKIASQMQAIKEKYRLDFEQILPNYFKNEFITFQLNTGEKFGAVALTNGEKVGQLLLDLSSEYATDIRIFKEANIPSSFFGLPFQKFERPFFTIIDNYLVMANNASSIQSFLNSYSTNRLLINDPDYVSFNNQLSSSATLSFYVNKQNSNDIFGRNLKLPYYKQYQAKTGFGNFNAFCYQLSGDKGKFISNLILLKKEEKKAVVDSLQTDSAY